jgi:hypothetical protein
MRPSVTLGPRAHPACPIQRQWMSALAETAENTAGIYLSHHPFANIPQAAPRFAPDPPTATARPRGPQGVSIHG